MSKSIWSGIALVLIGLLLILGPYAYLSVAMIPVRDMFASRTRLMVILALPVLGATLSVLGKVWCLRVPAGMRGACTIYAATAVELTALLVQARQTMTSSRWTFGAVAIQLPPSQLNIPGSMSWTFVVHAVCWFVAFWLFLAFLYALARHLGRRERASQPFGEPPATAALVQDVALLIAASIAVVAFGALLYAAIFKITPWIGLYLALWYLLCLCPLFFYLRILWRLWQELQQPDELGAEDVTANAEVARALATSKPVPEPSAVVRARKSPLALPLVLSLSILICAAGVFQVWPLFDPLSWTELPAGRVPFHPSVMPAVP
jgi:hypothetical protein